MQTLKGRQDLHRFLERKAEFAVRGEKSAHKRLSEAEAEMEIRNWEKRNSDIALYETHQELGPQRSQLQQANQWAEQAQREDEFVWSFGNEEKTLLRKSQKNLPRN